PEPGVERAVGDAVQLRTPHPVHRRRQLLGVGAGGGHARVREPRRGPGDLVEQQIQPFRGGGPTPRIRSAHDRVTRRGTTPRAAPVSSAARRGGATPASASRALALAISSSSRFNPLEEEGRPPAFAPLMTESPEGGRPPAPPAFASLMTESPEGGRPPTPPAFASLMFSGLRPAGVPCRRRRAPA